MLLWMSLALGSTTIDLGSTTIDDGAGLEPDDDVTHRGPCAEVGEPHLLDEGRELRTHRPQSLGQRWASASAVVRTGGPLIAQVCDVSHREAEEDEGERKCVLYDNSAQALLESKQTRVQERTQNVPRSRCTAPSS